MEIQYRVIRSRRYRKQRLKVLHEEAPFVIDKLDLSRIQSLSEGTSQHRQQNSSLETSRMRVPLNVEIGRKCGLGTVLQHVHPPRIFRAGRHMIRHDVEQQSHAAVL